MISSAHCASASAASRFSSGSSAPRLADGASAASNKRPTTVGFASSAAASASDSADAGTTATSEVARNSCQSRGHGTAGCGSAGPDSVTAPFASRSSAACRDRQAANGCHGAARPLQERTRTSEAISP